MSSYWKNQYQNRGEGVDGPASSPLGEAPEVGSPSSPEDGRTVQAAASPTPRLLAALRHILAECDQRPKDDDFAYDLARVAAGALAKADCLKAYAESLPFIPCPGPAGKWPCVHPEGLGHGGLHRYEGEK